MRRLALALLLTLSPTAPAQQDVFEVAVSGAYAPETCLIVPRIWDALQWFNPDRLELDLEAPFDPIPRSIASPDHRRVFGILPASGSVTIVIVSPGGQQTPFFTGLAAPGVFATDLTVAASGRVFVRYVQSGSPRLAVISPAGVLEATFPLTNSVFGAFTIAGDGCTLYYRATGNVVARFDACSGTALTDFAAVGATDLQFLPDGRVVLVSGSQVLLYSAAGVIDRTIATLPEGRTATQLAVSADGTRIYVDGDLMCTEPSVLFELSLATGQELSRRELTMQGVTGIVAGAGAATIPTATETALLALAILLATAGVFLLKR